MKVSMLRMIEPLESRTLFSITPQAALFALRTDFATIGTKIKTMTVANQWAIKVLHRQIPGLSDTALLQQANFVFNNHVAVLNADFTVARSLLAQDVTRLINVTHTNNKHPNVAVLAQRVITAENILIAQGNTTEAIITKDTNVLQQQYIAALTPIPYAHPINATLAVSVGNIATSFDQAFAAITTTVTTIATTDTANLITALEPNGVLPNAA